MAPRSAQDRTVTWRDVAPFLGAGVLGLAVLPVGSTAGPVEVWILVAAAVVTLIAVTLSVRAGRRTWLAPLSPVLCVLVLALARGVGGDAQASGIAALFFLPVLWSAIHGTRLELLLTVTASLLAFWVPALAIGEPRYPTIDLGRGVVLLLMAAVVAPTVQRLVNSRAREQQQLRATSRRLREILDGARATSIISTDLNGIVTTFSAGAEVMFGMDADEVVGRRNIASLFEPDDLQAMGEDIDTKPGFPLFVALSAGAETATVLRIAATDDHTPIFTRQLVTEMHDESGQRTGFLSVGYDVSREVRDHDELNASVQRWRTLLEHLPDTMVAVIDDSGTQTSLGGSPELRAMLRPSLHPPYSPTVRSLIASARSGDHAELDLRDGPDGSVVHLAAVQLDDSTSGATLLVARDVSVARTYEEQLTFMAHHDPTSGLMNRRGFDEALRAGIAAHRPEAPGVLLELDLDHFKQVNDSLGHAAGDHLIREIGQLLRSQLRQGDDAARLGGDEFAILLPRANHAAARAAAERLVDAVRNLTATMGEHQSKVTASVGGTTLRAGQDSETTMRRADNALYEAKRAGRNAYAIVDDVPEPDLGTPDADTSTARPTRRHTVADRLNDLIDHDAFELFLQPIIGLESGAVVAAEALLRMRDEPDVSPGEFIQALDGAGLSHRLDQAVLTKAAPLLRTLLDQGLEIRLHANISARSLGYGDLVPLVRDLVERHDLPPGSLVLEVTETSPVPNLVDAASDMRALSELGCLFALDDFGAGNASMVALKHLPFDLIKINGEFVTASAESALDLSLVRATVSVAQAAGCQTIAEYVSSDELAVLMRAEGVDCAQGFALGRPMRLPDFLQFDRSA